MSFHKVLPEYWQTLILSMFITNKNTNPFKTEKNSPTKSNFNFRYVKLCDLDIS